LTSHSRERVDRRRDPRCQHGQPILARIGCPAPRLRHAFRRRQQRYGRLDNDYNDEGLNAKSDFVYKLLQRLVANGVPISPWPRGRAACKAVTFWGIIDKYSWLNDYAPLGCSGSQKPLGDLWDDNYKKKTAYTGVLGALLGL